MTENNRGQPAYAQAPDGGLDAGPDGSGEEAADLAAMISRATGSRRCPPVEKWEPSRTLDIGMAIAADGIWSYQGSPIRRPALVRLFSSVLRKDADGSTWLVTPAEKVAVHVEDAPFIAVECVATRLEEGGRVLTFRTNVGDLVRADADHTLRFEGGEGGAFKPYIGVRGRLEALASRPVALQLADYGEELRFGGRDVYGVRSCGQVFPMMQMRTLRAQVGEGTV